MKHPVPYREGFRPEKGEIADFLTIEQRQQIWDKRNELFDVVYSGYAVWAGAFILDKESAWESCCECCPALRHENFYLPTGDTMVEGWLGMLFVFCDEDWPWLAYELSINEPVGKREGWSD